MGLGLKLCTDGVMNVAVFKTVYRRGTECGCLKVCTDWLLNVAVFKSVYRLGPECGCV